MAGLQIKQNKQGIDQMRSRSGSEQTASGCKEADMQTHRAGYSISQVDGLMRTEHFSWSKGYLLAQKGMKFRGVF